MKPETPIPVTKGLVSMPYFKKEDFMETWSSSDNRSISSISTSVTILSSY